jgi:regulator of protease activity HflC (stomatin/prohibitin superfamily)
MTSKIDDRDEQIGLCMADEENHDEQVKDVAGISTWARLGSWFLERQTRLAWHAFFLSILLLLLWPYCIITVDSGHTGVLYRRFFGGTVLEQIYREGTHFIFPWDTMHIFDIRVHEDFQTFPVLTRDGLALTVDISLLYHPIDVLTPVLLTTVGTNYREKLILPMLLASVRNVAAEFGQEDFYNKTSRSIQDSIHVRMTEFIGRNPISIDNLLIRAVHLPEGLDRAINDKMIAEQAVLRQNVMVKEAMERLKVQFVNAEAVRMTQEIINPGMTPGFLRWQGIEATRDLAQSQNSKFVIVGGKDGLPVILNTEPAAANPGAVPPARPEPAAANPENAAADKEKEMQDYLGRVQDNVDSLTRRLKDLLSAKEAGTGAPEPKRDEEGKEK